MNSLTTPHLKSRSAKKIKKKRTPGLQTAEKPRAALSRYERVWRKSLTLLSRSVSVLATVRFKSSMLAVSSTELSTSLWDLPF